MDASESSSDKAPLIARTAPCSAFYLFCDIRGFSRWMESNQLDAIDLLEPFYSCAFEHFGERKEQKYHKRVAKLLGDGYLVVHEYEKNNSGMFASTLKDLLSGVLAFRLDFYKRLSESTIPGKNKLKCAFGLSFGAGVRLTIPGYPLDFVSHRINLSARLASVAEENELVFDIDLWDDIDPADLINKRRDKRTAKKMGEIPVGVADIDI